MRLKREDCIENINAIKIHIINSKNLSNNDIDGVWNYLKDSGSLLGLNLETKAALKYMLDVKKSEVIEKIKTLKIASTIQKQYIDSECKEEYILYNMSEDCGRHLETICNNFRSLLSSIKREIRESY